MLNKFKISSLQKTTGHVSCKMGESIPKGIILYYHLVSILDRLFSSKENFDSFLFFSLLKKNEFIKTCFFRSPTSPSVPYPQPEALEACFLGLVTGLVGLELYQKAHHYSQEKLSQPKIQNRRNFVAEYYRQKSP
jgi:hypothetical protein